MIPELISLGPLSVHSFGLMMVLTFVVGWKRLELSLEDHGYEGIHAEPMVFYAAIGGVVGARVLFLIANFSVFLQKPLEMIFTGAGFIFYGGFIGGFLAVVYYLKKNSLPFLRMADIVAPSLAIGYGVGRIGCQLSGDGDYGKVSDLPWAMGYPLGAVPTSPGVLVHPAPIYESVAAFAICWLLLKRTEAFSSKAGSLFGFYLILMSIERFLVEIIRIEPIIGSGLTQAQWIAIFIALAGLLFIFRPTGSTTQKVEG